MANILQFVREEDYVEYFLFPEEQNDNQLEAINEIVRNFTSEYIWHKDGFKVQTMDGNTVVLEEALTEKRLEGSFHGVTHFGDNIQDEWLVVAICLELTRKVRGLVVRVVDSDGEFLLIEAANHLPKWANPESCEGKVFLYNGQVHLVSNNGNDIDEPIAALRAEPGRFVISNAAFESIHARIKDFPGKIHESLHRATVFVPTGVAWLLRKNPKLIAKAVLAFCNRDPIDSRAIKAMRYFPPEDRVYTSVTFTKCLYAMLSHNHFVPDRRTGWNLPATKTAEHKAHLIGMKLACGFEILACDGRKTADLAMDKHWLAYVESLKKREYFQSFIEGSKDHTALLEKAKLYYREHCESARVTSASVVITDLLKDISTDELRRAQKNLPAEDSDEWLNVSSDDLDNMLEKRYGQASLITKEKNLPAVLNDFLEQKSDFDGVETKTENIDFDPNEFQTAMHNLLEMVIPEDKWDSNSDMSDYENDDELERNLEQMTGKADFQEYLDQMDRELAKTTIGKSFEKKNKSPDTFDDIEDFTPVDIDANAVKNMMESYRSQLGGPGPASTLLGAMGIKVKDEEKPLKNTQV